MQTNNRLGVVLMVATTLVFAIQDGISRHLASEYNTYMIVMIRYWFFAAFVTAVSARQSGGLRKTISTSQPILQTSRGVILAVEICVAVLGFTYLGLVESHAIESKVIPAEMPNRMGFLQEIGPSHSPPAKAQTKRCRMPLVRRAAPAVFIPLADASAGLIVVAGMEGALPSVVAGLVSRPVIAVPTSVGYGVSFGGVAPLLTMLNSCAAGIGVMNIDNGFGAAILAGQILRTATKLRAS